MRIFKSVAMLCAVVAITAPSHAEDYPFRKPQEKAVMGESFPKAGLIFRGESRRQTGPGYEEWKADVSGNVGIIRKFVREELDHPKFMVEATLSENLKRFAAENPEQLFLLHYNARCKLFDFHKDKFWVGHYLQKEGSQCETEIEPDQQIIVVPEIENFNYQSALRGQETAVEDTLLLLVEKDGEGNYLWDLHEWVHLVGVDEEGGTLNVVRGAYDTEPRKFEAGSCYITQIQLYRRRMMLNLSLDCPRDENGDQAADVMVDLFESWFREGGSLQEMDGIAFDVQYWDIHSGYDTNNDGSADGGIVNGEPRWSKGVYQFSKSIRDRFGDDFIIITDGHRMANTQFVGIHNGMESEGLVQHNDAWRGISRTVNLHRYWDTFNTTKHKISFIAPKLKLAADMEHQNRLYRFAHGMAACLGTMAAHGIDDIVKGVENEHFWLGEPVGPMINLADRSHEIVYEMSDHLDGEKLQRWTSEMGAVITTEQDAVLKVAMGDVASDEPDFELTHEGKLNEPSLSFELTLDLPPGDLYLTVDLKSEKARHGFEGTDIPRRLEVKLDGHYEEPSTVGSSNGIWTLVGERDFFRSEFYVRNAGGETGRKGVKVQFQITDRSDVYLRNLVIRNAPVAYLREFENGAVLVNPGLEPYAFDLNAAFGEQIWRRLEGSPGDETADTELNDGSVIADSGSIELEPVSALFLRKEE